MSELKPCPFCDGNSTAKLEHHTSRDGSTVWWVACIACAGCTADADTSGGAIKAWTKRAEEVT